MNEFGNCEISVDFIGYAQAKAKLTLDSRTVKSKRK